MAIDTEQEITIEVVCPHCGWQFEETQVVPITVELEEFDYEPD